MKVPILTYILGTNISSRSHYFRDSSGYDLIADKLIYLGWSADLILLLLRFDYNFVNQKELKVNSRPDKA